MRDRYLVLVQSAAYMFVPFNIAAIQAAVAAAARVAQAAAAAAAEQTTAATHYGSESTLPQTLLLLLLLPWLLLLLSLYSELFVPLPCHSLLDTAGPFFIEY